MESGEGSERGSGMRNFVLTLNCIVIFLNALYLLYSLLVWRKKAIEGQEEMERMCGNCIHKPMDCESCIRCEDL